MTVLAERADSTGTLLPEQRLFEIAHIPDPNEQIKQLMMHYYDHMYNQEDPSRLGEAAQLADFAADPSSPHKLLVRIEALETSLKIGYGTEILGDQFDPVHDVKLWRTAEIAKSHNLYARLWPDESDLQASILGPIDQLALIEGISTSIYGADHRYVMGEAGKETIPTDYPAFTILFLDKIVGLSAQEYLTISQQAAVDKFLPLALAINAELSRANGLPTTPNQKITDWHYMRHITHLKKIGEEYNLPVSELINNPSAESKQYIKALSDLLYRRVAVDVFPEEFQAGAEEGFKQLVADAVYAVNVHLRNGRRTSASLPLSGSDKELPLTLEGDEPLQLLQALVAACKQLHTIKENTYVFRSAYEPRTPYQRKRTLKVTDSQDYGLYRIIMPDSSMNASVYVRPMGAETYDAALEYGRNGEGVEASISYVVDPSLPAGKPIKVGKHRGKQPDNRISIRLDREGVRPSERGQGTSRNPRQAEGTLSLDVGSVIGDEDWTGTKLGRFLAWGNLLRTQATKQATQLNHVTRYFSPQDGKADYFAQACEQLRADLEACRLDSKDITQLFSGRVTLAGLHERE